MICHWRSLVSGGWIDNPSAIRPDNGAVAIALQINIQPSIYKTAKALDVYLFLPDMIHD
jgi:hypothetical protein